MIKNKISLTNMYLSQMCLTEMRIVSNWSGLSEIRLTGMPPYCQWCSLPLYIFELLFVFVDSEAVARHRHIVIFTISNLMDSKGCQPFR